MQIIPGDTYAERAIAGTLDSRFDSTGNHTGGGPTYVEHGFNFVIPGPAAASRMSLYVAGREGQSITLKRAHYVLEAGQIDAALEVNGTVVPGYELIQVTPAPAILAGTLDLRNGDLVSLVLSNPVNSPRGMTFEIVLEYGV